VSERTTMLIATGAAMVLLTIVWKPALVRFRLERIRERGGFCQKANNDERPRERAASERDPFTRVPFLAGRASGSRAPAGPNLCPSSNFHSGRE